MMTEQERAERGWPSTARVEPMVQVEPGLWVPAKDLRRCPTCLGTERVCEWHRDLAWPFECDCGAGMHCPDCTAIGAAVVARIRVEGEGPGQIGRAGE